MKLREHAGGKWLAEFEALLAEPDATRRRSLGLDWLARWTQEASVCVTFPAAGMAPVLREARRAGAEEQLGRDIVKHCATYVRGEDSPEGHEQWLLSMLCLPLEPPLLYWSLQARKLS